MLYQLSYSRNEDEDSAGGRAEQRLPPAPASLDGVAPAHNTRTLDCDAEVMRRS